MIAFLRRHQPRSKAVAVLYWVVAVAVALGILLVIFYFLDNFLPAQF
jgi:hypothetical protein